MSTNEGKTIVAIGEILWDCFPEGKQLGGAPFNFAYHAGKLGTKAFLLSAIGNDREGNEAKVKAESLSIETILLQINEYPTGTVVVKTDVNGIPDYRISSPAAWDHIERKERDKDIIQKADALCFGSLAQRNKVSRNTIQYLIDTASPSTLIVFDINLRQHFYTEETIVESLKKTDVLKLNEDELPVVCQLSDIDCKSEKKAIQAICSMYNIALIAYTKGESGSYLYNNEEFSFMESPKVNVSDTVGAGDAFTAALVTGYMDRMDLRRIHRRSIDLAAFVCTKEGATPEYKYSN